MPKKVVKKVSRPVPEIKPKQNYNFYVVAYK
jgi:hypothetical protein